MQIRKAERKNIKIRLAIEGPSGSGKTFSALLIAYGLTEDWDKVIIIDTENGSAELYAELGGYSVLPLAAPYSPERYIAAIELAEKQGFEVIIIDSLSHAWAGEGGVLEQQGKAADTKYKGNSWSAWREFTPKHNALVEAMLKSKSHIIATLRTKTEYIQVEENGSKKIKKVGTVPIQRDGIEYEFAVVFDLATDHMATASKDRTGIFDRQLFTPGSDTGRILRQWLSLDEKAAISPVVTKVSSTPANAYTIQSSEIIRTGQGKEYVKADLRQGDRQYTVWSQDTSLKDLPDGTVIFAELTSSKNSIILSSYTVYNKGDAA